jgi:hypothetical protein
VRRSAVIRNVTVIEFKPGTSREYLDQITEAMRNVSVPGMHNLTMGADLGLKDGNLHYAVVADFDDAEAYRRFDSDPEHERIRQELTRPAFVRYERVQYELPDGAGPAAA